MQRVHLNGLYLYLHCIYLYCMCLFVPPALSGWLGVFPSLSPAHCVRAGLEARHQQSDLSVVNGESGMRHANPFCSPFFAHLLRLLSLVASNVYSWSVDSLHNCEQLCKYIVIKHLVSGMDPWLVRTLNPRRIMKKKTFEGVANPWKVVNPWKMGALYTNCPRWKTLYK